MPKTKTKRAKKYVERTPQENGLRVEAQALDAVADRITGPRAAHDKNKCRVYRCLICKSEGVKNEKRGLGTKD